MQIMEKHSRFTPFFVFALPSKVSCFIYIPPSLLITQKYNNPCKLRFVFLFVLKMGNSDWNCPLIALIMRFFLACTDFCIN